MDLYGDYGKWPDEGSRPDRLGFDGYTHWATAEERVGDFEHCSPELLNSGVSCADTPRRSCECDHGGSHDHLVQHPTRLHGADAEAWGVPDGTEKSTLPTSYFEWLAEGSMAQAESDLRTDQLRTADTDSDGDVDVQ